jgi:fructose-bisphosphate aldolase/2-amino-3,7-dideoxy-D-threo-hept-6-ulosonate synthase
MAANAIRLSRIARPGGPILMVPMDHGVSAGPIEGIAEPAKTLAAVAGSATCVTVHKGLVPLCAPFADRVGVLLHLSASTDGGPDPHEKRLVASVEEALRLGCDGVSIHVNVGSATEPAQLQDAGKVSSACNEWGVPLVSMMYPRGPKVKDPHDPGLVAHAARLGAELGSDAVKVPFTGKTDTFRDAAKGCPVPVIMAGGPKRDSFEAFLQDVRAAKAAGARGVSIGRNVFQHPRPGDAMAAIARVFE